MISAVCGRAPPCVSPPKAPLLPPEWPDISHDLLSVTKTRAFSCASKEVAKRHTAMKISFFCKGSSFTWKHVRSRLWLMHRQSQLNSRGASTLVPSGPIYSSDRKKIYLP